MDYICIICKQQFQPKKKDGKFCDNCRRKYGTHIARTYKNLTRSIPLKICGHCSKEFSAFNKHQRFCKECKKIPNIVYTYWRKENPERSKEIQRNYRSRNVELVRKRTRENQVKLNDKLRFGGFRLQALQRDNFICQICNKDVSSKNMAIVHHINHIRTDNRLDNFQTLCKSCHPKHHYKTRKLDSKKHFIR